MAKAPHFFVLLFAFVIATQLSLSLEEEVGSCLEFDELSGHRAKCDYLNAHGHPTPCVPESYVRYLHLFYCTFGASPLLGRALLALCLLLLFYVLADTASRYFCSSLEGLSRLLSLPPAVAGVTLLSLGNGAPDVFSSLVSFAGPGRVGSVGLSSILGGALFVTTVVVGVIGVTAGSSPVEVDRAGFLPDVCFLLLALGLLLAMLVAGEIGVLGSALFVSLYTVYVVAVSASQCQRRSSVDETETDTETPLLLDGVVEVIVEPAAIGVVSKEVDEADTPGCRIWLLYILRLPLYLPRRLTIPDVSEERWLKPYAAASAFSSPILLAALWNTRKPDVDGIFLIYLLAGLAGLAMGTVALGTTESSKPPRKFLLPWLAGGFLMSVVWTYITARELVSLLVSIGHVLGISPSVLGVTVLAWGNSVGDLTANVAMARSGREGGPRVAVSGCYAGPIFNTLVGLGLSLVLASANAHPSPYVVPGDPSLFLTLGFLVGGLTWALVMLPARGMKLDRVVGVGLLTIYFSFLCLRISQSLGLVHIGT